MSSLYKNVIEDITKLATDCVQNLSYKIFFEDKSIFTGWSLDKSRKNVPDKPIKALVYFFDRKKIVLKDYISYNHFIEKVHVGGKTRITQILLIGRKKNESHLIIINFKDKKVFKEIVEIGKEYQTPLLKGWKRGIS